MIVIYNRLELFTTVHNHLQPFTTVYTLDRSERDGRLLLIVTIIIYN